MSKRRNFFLFPMLIFSLTLTTQLFSGRLLRRSKDTPSLHQGYDEQAQEKEGLSPLEQDFAMTTTNPVPYKQQKITLKTSDGLLRHGVLTTRSNAKGNVVLCHPAAYDQDFLIPYEEKTFSYYNCIRFDFRRHGQNSSGQTTTLGKKEIYEVNAAVEYLKNDPLTKDLPIYGFGVSMGAVVLIEAESKKHQFDALILQSPFESLREQVKRSFGFFRGPLMHNLIFREPVRLYAKLKYRIRMCKVYPVRSIKNINVPVFLIHSRDDQVIDIKAYQQLKVAGKHCIKETWTPARGRHTELFKTYPDLYTKKCNAFLGTKTFNT